MSATPEPLTEGVYGRDGTVDGWIRSQKAEAYVAEADSYYHLYLKLISTLEGMEDKPANGTNRTISWDLEKHWLDVDSALASYCSTNGVQEPTDLRERAALHRRIICEQFDLDSDEVTSDCALNEGRTGSLS